MKKKLLAVLLIGVLALSLVACGEEEAAPAAAPAAEETAEEAPAEEETEEVEEVAEEAEAASEDDDMLMYLGEKLQLLNDQLGRMKYDSSLSKEEVIELMTDIANTAAEAHEELAAKEYPDEYIDGVNCMLYAAADIQAAALDFIDYMETQDEATADECVAYTQEADDYISQALDAFGY